jgi:hypothetical protein
MTKYNTPTTFVALLRAKKVWADVPEAPHASAHRILSKTDMVSSARQNIVSCEAILSTKTLLSGLSKINLEESGCSKELLYAKKAVNDIHNADNKARSNVNSCQYRRGLLLIYSELRVVADRREGDKGHVSSISGSTKIEYAVTWAQQ